VYTGDIVRQLPISSEVQFCVLEDHLPCRDYGEFGILFSPEYTRQYWTLAELAQVTKATVTKA
jgi:hypothetical protein